MTLTADKRGVRKCGWLTPAALFAPVLLACLVIPAPTSAQSIVNTKQANEIELERVRETMRKTSERQQALRKEIENLDQDVAAINRALIETSKSGQDLETKVSAVEAELAQLNEDRDKLRLSLQAKSAVLSEVLGALQRMGRKPPPAILIRPEDAISSLRSAIVLGSVVPHIRSETDILLVEMQALTQTTRKIEAQNLALTDALNNLAEDETRLSLLIEEKNQLVSKSREDLETEQQTAARLAEKATSLEELIRKLETQIASAAAAAQAAQEADVRRREREEQRLAEARKKLSKLKDSTKIATSSSFDTKNSDTARIEPAIAFSKARGELPLPVSGVELYRYGSQNAVGERNTNLAFATRPNARVRSPADGWVVYAGPFRSYGQLLILNAGEGYHVVLSGMSQINVETGRFVLAGEPVGRMGTTRVAGSIPLELGSNRPVLYVEFRKDGKPFDPSPWWSAGVDKGPKDDS